MKNSFILNKSYIGYTGTTYGNRDDSLLALDRIDEVGSLLTLKLYYLGHNYTKPFLQEKL